ncbi:MAG: acyl carrier protein [Thermoanaerobaculia bacterium]|nr:acyl carrier protein [Thermoanaerobaculia bacterium]
MSSGRVFTELAELAQRHLEGIGPITAEQRLIEDLELDSVRLLTLAIEAENHFRVRLDELGTAEIETVGDLVEAIERALESREAGRP